MKENTVRLLFTVIFSVLSTSVATVTLYTLPVLYYAGYQSQVPFIILGFLLGALLFSIVGTVLTYYVKKPIIPGLVISVVIGAALILFYKLSGVVDNMDLLVGSMASESFAVFFATMFQSYPKPGGSKLMAGISIAVFTLLNTLIFVVTAEIYLTLGQEYLPNIIVYFELMVAVVAAITLLLFARPVKNEETE